MDSKKKNLIILSSAVVTILILAFTVVYYLRQSKEKDAEMAEIVEQMNFEKEQIQKEYADMSHEFEGYTPNIKNDSLVKLLNNQKSKVQQLLDELRITKSTNARRIAELKDELAAVRKVMIVYINQIDSLNTANHLLRAENSEVKKKYEDATESLNQVSKEKENLTKVVDRASILSVSHFSMTPLNDKGKKTTWFSKSANLQFNFTIEKNVTAQTGNKTIYLRITRPDEEVLTKPGSTFQYEDKKIAYSASKKIEYSGDALSDVIYWKISEILPPGNYRADFFADGNRIGSFSFKFEK